MPLRLLTPASNIPEQISVHLSPESRVVRAFADASGGALPDALSLAAPHPVFNLGLDAIRLNKWMSKVQMTGWRYFVTSGDHVIAAAEASMSEPEGTVRGTLTNNGPFVEGAEKALVVAEKYAKASKVKFVLGMLRIPALHVVSLWLRGDDGSGRHDRFIPVAPVPQFFKANIPIKPSEFSDALRRLQKSVYSQSARDETSN